MVKDIRIVDSETSPKQEVKVQTSEIRERASVSEVGAEKIIVPEVGIEIHEAETIEQKGSVVGEVLHEGKAIAPKKTQQKPVEQRDRLEEEIEDILEEDLKEMYLSMPPEKRAEFREKGEEIRTKIRELLRSAKINAKKIFGLIRMWLKVIPGVNRFFLEQEAKIKTDKILLVTEEERKRAQNETL